MSVPHEISEQITLAGYLDRAGLVWFHVPNGGRRDKGEAQRLRASGVKAGVPDVLILSPAPGARFGAALELKRIGESYAAVKPEQWAWLGKFLDRGMVPIVAFGWRDAVFRLRSYGYRV